jgi:hypothetical protein
MHVGENKRGMSSRVPFSSDQHAEVRRFQSMINSCRKGEEIRKNERMNACLTAHTRIVTFTVGLTAIGCGTL